MLEKVFEKIYEEEKANFNSDFIDSGYSVRFNEEEGFYLLKVWFELSDEYKNCDYYPVVSKLFEIDTTGKIIEESDYKDWL